MKTKNKLIPFLLFAGMLFNFSPGYSQSCRQIVPLLTPFRYEIQLPSSYFLCVTDGTANCASPVAGTYDVPGVGFNLKSPNYMLDILCDPTKNTKKDVNISCPSNNNAVGYRIGGNMVLWHNGNTSNIFVGINAGGPDDPGTFNNVCMGFNAGFLGVGSGNNNNVYLGVNAGSNPSGGQHDNVFVGYNTGLANNMAGHTFIGSGAGQKTVNADFDTYVGYLSFQNSTTGSANVGLGYNSGHNNITGSGDSYIGVDAGIAYTNEGNCTALGHFADFSVDNLVNAAAIGANSQAKASNQTEIGDNNVTTTMGMSGYIPSTPVTRLELNTENGGAPFTVTPTTTSPVQPGATGWSGLRFDDLTKASTPTANPGDGLLSVNSNGDVIYVTDKSPGYCTSGLTKFTADAGYDLNNASNFYFAGNGAGIPVNNVVIGLNCVTPIAKLQVFQHSGAYNSKGTYVQNNDLASGGYTITNPPTELIGIQSYIPLHAPSFLNLYNIAGWFSAPSWPNFPQQYAIFVPPGPNIPKGSLGGMVSIGWHLGTNTNSPKLDLLAVNSMVYGYGWDTPSDSIIKKDILPLQYGLSVIRQLNPVSFKYNGKGATDSTNTQYGLVAENVNAVAPYAIDSATIVMDSGDAPTDILSINQNAIIYTAINAIKQLDSSVNSKGLPVVIATDSGTLDKRDTLGHIKQLPRVRGNSFAASADSNFDTAATAITNPMAIVDSLKGIYFKWKRSGFTNKNFPVVQQVGFSAQQVKPFLPQVVSKDDSGYYEIDYGRITPLLVEGMKQQQQKINRDSLRIDSLEATLSSVMACIDSICGSGSRMMSGNNSNTGSNNTGSSNQQNVTLSSAAILYQNTPNPFGQGGTKINYFIPDGTVGASIVFFDTYGTKLKEVQLTQTGMGTINVNPSQLSNGIYTYSLIINGNVLDTKKMVFAK